MYKSLTTVNGVTAVGGFVGSSQVDSGADGLVFAPSDNGSPGQIVMPTRLMDWLVDLRLLRHIPLVYLVPDSALLPTESIRFFHVDLTWMDRVIDGVFAAANTGTTDSVYGYGLLASARLMVDQELEKQAAAKAPDVQWSVANGMTGMLIRSELARRWPDMIVEAWTEPVESWDNPITSKPMAVLRSESVSRDIYIALFAGKPKMITVREPFSGVRFGVEPDGPNSTSYKIDSRNPNGTNVLNGDDPVPIPITWRSGSANRVINFEALGNHNLVTDPGSPRQLAINLEQKPYMQEFKESNELPENLGSQDLPEDVLSFRKGRYMKLDGLKLRLQQQQKAGA